MSYPIAMSMSNTLSTARPTERLQWLHRRDAVFPLCSWTVFFLFLPHFEVSYLSVSHIDMPEVRRRLLSLAHIRALELAIRKLRGNKKTALDLCAYVINQFYEKVVIPCIVWNLKYNNQLSIFTTNIPGFSENVKFVQL